MRPIRVLAASLAVIGVIAGVVTASAGADRAPRHDFEAVALAIPSQHGTNADDNATRIDMATGWQLRVDGVATTSLTCDGCSGHAATLQVVYARRTGTFTADNVATAWASGCTGCNGWALSLQIVIVRHAGDVTAANRALALNATCTDCSVSAAAVQVVVVGPGRWALSPSAISQIYALRAQLLAQLAGTPPTAAPAVPQARRAQIQAQPQSPLQTTAQQLQNVVAQDLRAGSATHNVQLQTG